MREEIIGNATLYCGDCMDVLPTLGKVDAVVTDPPYGIGISKNPVRQKHEKMEWDSTCASEELVDDILGMGLPTIIWGGNYFKLPPSRRFLVWDKLQPENFSLAMCEMAWCSFDGNAKIFKKSVTSYDKAHPTQKPVELMGWCIKYLPSTPSTILDPFMGSGTTGVAALKLGRHFIGIEKEPKYFDIACKRVEQAVYEMSLFS